MWKMVVVFIDLGWCGSSTVCFCFYFCDGPGNGVFFLSFFSIVFVWEFDLFATLCISSAYDDVKDT